MSVFPKKVEYPFKTPIHILLLIIMPNYTSKPQRNNKNILPAAASLVHTIRNNINTTSTA